MSISKIIIDQDLCIGAASCIIIADKTFEFNEANKAVVKNTKHDEDEVIIAAAKSCPTKAIFLYNEKGEKIFP